MHSQSHRMYALEMKSHVQSNNKIIPIDKALQQSQTME